VKDVHHHLKIIEHDPLARRESIHCSRLDPILVSQPAFNFAGDRFQVRLGRGRADDEKIREG
jgi:hypothetical protein